MTDQDTMRELERIAPVRTWRNLSTYQFMACYHAMRAATTPQAKHAAIAAVYLILS